MKYMTNEEIELILRSVPEHLSRDSLGFGGPSRGVSYKVAILRAANAVGEFGRNIHKLYEESGRKKTALMTIPEIGESSCSYIEWVLQGDSPEQIASKLLDRSPAALRRLA